VLERIRIGCRRVSEVARSVRIVEARLDSYAADLNIDRLEPPPLDSTGHYVGDESTTVAFFVALDGVNFGSGYFPHLRKRPGMSGYFTIASSLADRFRDVGPLSASDLAQIDPAACAKLFGQEMTVEPIAELMGLFATSWNDLGVDLIDRFGGDVRRLVAASDGSAARLVDLLAAQKLFRDVSDYDGIEVPFFKRAQILASDLALALPGSGLGHFEDLDRLTIFADNLVPHVLRMDGLLEYAPELLERIDREILIPAGSPEEIEIRACAVHAVERLVEALRRRGVRANARQLDVLLWSRGQGADYKSRPRHRTRTVYY